ncbi:MAG: hypothetical protein Q7J64_00740, partial [Elusimicrobiota bacterium]|nr:hypothetical protein [Elusimicrobiota bacterium]
RRLACVEGRFPDRTYLAVLDLATGARTKRRLKGFVLGGGLALSRDARRVLLDAGKVGDLDASRSEPTNRVVLAVNIDDGRVLTEIPVGDAGTVALGHPAWSPDPIAVWNSKDGIRWSAFGDRPAGGLLDGPAAWRALLLDEPFLVVAEKQHERPRMVVYDLRDAIRTAEWRVALSAAPLASRLDGTALSSRWMSETGSFVLEAGDPKTGRRVPLLETDGEIETAFETDRGLFAVAKDPSRRNDTGKNFLAPRVLLVLEKDGRRWSVPWTSRPGEFFGVDPKDGRLLFAVLDRDKPGAWALAPTRAALTAAGAAIDGKD